MAKGNDYRWVRRAEDRIYSEQVDLITKSCGERAADMANYGWGVDVTDNAISVATKVYGHGILVSEYTKGQRGGPVHDWRD